jgi:hypothetical protein
MEAQTEELRAVVLVAWGRRGSSMSMRLCLLAQLDRAGSDRRAPTLLGVQT